MMDPSAPSSEQQGQPPAASGGWGTMGGDPGDGIIGSPYGMTTVHPPTATTTPSSTSPAAAGAGTTWTTASSPSQAVPGTPQSYAAPSTSAGSITRFATPSMQQQHQPALASGGGTSSYVERAAQAYASYPVQQSPYAGHMPATPSAAMQQQQQQPYAPSPPRSQQLSPPPGAAAGGYAARSQMAYAPQGGGGGYAAGAAAGATSMYGMQQQQQPLLRQGAAVPSPQQQQQQQAPQYYASPAATTPPGPTSYPPPASNAGGSYAARSAQAYSSSSPSVPPQVAAGTASPSSYAARSAQAYGVGGSMPQQQQQQQQQQQPIQWSGGGTGPAAYSGPGYSTGIPATVGGAPAPTGAAGASSAMYAQQYPTYSNVQQPATGMPPQGSSSSYVARSAQAGVVPQPGYATAAMSSSSAYLPQQQQQQQQQATYNAAMAANTLYGSGAGTGGGAPVVSNGQQQLPHPSAAQPGVAAPPHPYGQQQQPAAATVSSAPSSYGPSAVSESAQMQAAQQRMLTDATRKVQEHAYYMKQAMEQRNLPVVLDRAAHMVGELGGLPHGQHHHHQYHASTNQPNAAQTPSPSSGPANTGISPKLNPKNYYELSMRALEEMPAFEDYLLNLVKQPIHPPDSIQIVDLQAHSHSVQRKPYTMRELYDCTQYCPRVVSRLYLQISAGSALIRSGEVGAKFVLHDLGRAVRCEQNPIRGLFLRNFLLTALRDKLPDTPPVQPSPSPPAAASEEEQPSPAASEEVQASLPRSDENAAASGAATDEALEDDQDKGTVIDSIEFVLQNFMEMNKLWVRIQHLPGEGNNKDVRKRRERERNDLRILVGTNLVRLSQLECVTSKIYGEMILPRILEHIVVSGDPLSQAYLMDCLVQVFPDEYHIETLPILLNVCPRLRDKVNIRTILQGLMDRLANYLAEEELLDESDTNQVKKTLARDSFYLFEECVQKVYNARGPKLTAKEVIRLQTALLQFSVKCYPGNDSLISRCLGACVSSLRQANASYDSHDGTVATVPDDRVVVSSLDEASVMELEKLLSIPLDTLALRVLELEHYSALISFLPWLNRREVAMNMLKAVDNAGSTPKSVKEITELFGVIEPVMRDEHVVAKVNQDAVARASSLMAGLGVQAQSSSMSFSENDSSAVTRDTSKENSLVSKLVHLLDHEDPDVLFEMLQVARTHICVGGRHRASQTLVAVVFASVKLLRRLFKGQKTSSGPEPATATSADADEGEKVDSTEGEENASTVVDVAEGNEKETAVVDVAEEVTSAEPSSSEKPSQNETEVAEGNEPSELGSATATVEAPTSTDAKVESDAANAEKHNVDAVVKADESEHSTSSPIDVQEVRTSGAERPPTISSCRKVFVFIQETVATISKGNPEVGHKLYLEVALAADSFAWSSPSERSDYSSIAYELLSQALSIYEEAITESKAQQRCIKLMVGTLLASRSLSKEDYDGLITKTAVFAAKVVKKPEQCQLVGLCAYMFYPAEGPYAEYGSPQRSLECLQRSLKLADASTSANPSHVGLFVELLEHYLYFFEKKNPLVSHNYISGLVALIKEHLHNLVQSFEGDSRAVVDARGHFQEVIRYIRKKKADEASAERFGPIQVDGAD